MDMRNTRTLPALALSALCLAAALGCGGHNYVDVPWVDSFTPGQAAAGASVSIFGGNFKDLNSVSFGGQPALAYKVNSLTQITATVPDDAVTGAITVVNTKGLGTSYSSFIVQPTITAIEPTAGPPGTVITVTGSGFYDLFSVAINGETPGAAGASTFSYLDPNHVTVQVGSSTTTGALVLTASGLTATGPVFTVN